MILVAGESGLLGSGPASGFAQFSRSDESRGSIARRIMDANQPDSALHPGKGLTCRRTRLIQRWLKAGVKSFQPSVLNISITANVEACNELAQTSQARC